HTLSHTGRSPPCPTRRSSDLLNRFVRRLHSLRAQLQRRRQQAHPKGKVPTVASVTRQVEAIRHARNLKQLVPAKVEDTPKGVRLDRKSTRLNSSHGSISYAVF